MIFNDYVITTNNQINELKKMCYIMESLEKILKEHEKWTQEAFYACFLKTIHSTTGNFASSANVLVDRTTAYFNNFRESLISIDFLEFGEILANFRSYGETSLLEITEELYNDFKSAYGMIHDYRKLINDEDRALNYNACIEAIQVMLNNLNKFQYAVNLLCKVNEGLNKGVLEQGLEINLLNNGFDKNTYCEVTEPIYIIYNKLCEIANISLDSEPLNIVRMETGSFFIKFIGNKSILKVVGELLEGCHKVWVRNYTREGKKQNLVESTELFKSQYDIISEMRKAGLDVSEHDEIAKETLVLLLKQSNILLSTSPDIKINDKVLSKSEEVKKALSIKDSILLPDES